MSDCRQVCFEQPSLLRATMLASAASWIFRADAAAIALSTQIPTAPLTVIGQHWAACRWSAQA